MTLTNMKQNDIQSSSPVSLSTKPIEKKKKEKVNIDSKGRNHGIYYDACSKKRKISVCGMQPDIDPQCSLKPHSMSCTACFDNVEANETNHTRLWNVCNEKDGYTGR